MKCTKEGPPSVGTRGLIAMLLAVLVVGVACSSEGGDAGVTGPGTTSNTEGSVDTSSTDASTTSNTDASTTSNTDASTTSSVESGTGPEGEPEEAGPEAETVIDVGGDDVVLVAGLERFADCDSLLDYLHAEYSPRVGPRGFDDGGWWFGPVEIVEAFEEGAVAEETPLEHIDFSGTNVQEAGVDEADIVKTDGHRIIAISEGRLVVVDVATRTPTGSVEVTEGWDRQLFLHGDSVLLITRSTTEDRRSDQTVLESIDVSGSTPAVVETINVEGSYISARSIDGVARVILRYDPQWSFPFVYPQNVAGEEAAERINREAVLNTTVDDWLPHIAVGSTDSSSGSILTACGDVHAPTVFSGFGLTTVITVPVDGSFDALASTAVTAPGDTVYASLKSLYVATNSWVPSDTFDDETSWEQAWDERITNIQRFDITSSEASYEATGQVSGTIHNHFSLSEHDGHLRVVTTTGYPWGDNAESQVRVLRIEGSTLREIGSVGDIGRGEQVESVRFIGEVAYVVTFRQIDPFYTVDLSEPSNPTIRGELKIPGYSSYLHSIGDGLILGVGADADTDGRVTGAKVSLFDVSNHDAPVELAVWTAPSGWHDIGWDHRAFLWWAPQNLAVLPVTNWGEWAAAVVLHVANGTITEVGRVDHMVEDDETGRTDCRVVTPNELAARETQGFRSGINGDPSLMVVACEPQHARPTGFDCFDYREFTLEELPTELLGSSQSLEVCRPNPTPDAIRRSIIVGDELWTLSHRQTTEYGKVTARLHAHDLSTLERLAALEL